MRVFVDVDLYHDAEDPDRVSEALAAEPSRQQRLGDNSATDLGLRVSVNGWFLSSETFVSSNSIAEHIDYIVGVVHPRLDQLRELVSRGWHGRVTLFVLSPKGLVDLQIPATLVGHLASFGLDLSFFSHSPANHGE